VIFGRESENAIVAVDDEGDQGFSTQKANQE
jgi:hypothetical protein